MDVSPYANKYKYGVASNKSRIVFLLSIILASFMFALKGHSQTVTIGDAWWAYQQDCNGDGCKAGTLPAGMARLNWNPDVVNCNSTQIVFEKVYYRPCGSNTWTAIYTNAPHSITGCRSSDSQYVDIVMGGGCVCRDYKIEVYRSGQSNPDYRRSSTNDVDPAQHQEQLLSSYFRLSDIFASCASLNGAFGTQSDNNAAATKETGEPNHAGNTGGKSLWYCWIAPLSAPVEFNTAGSTYNTILAVYTNSVLTNLTLIAANKDGGAGEFISRVGFDAIAGVTYRIAVDGAVGDEGKVMSLSIGT